MDLDYDAATIRRLDKQHVFHSWSAQGQISPLPIAGAEGSWFWDADGKRYLDFSSQLVNVNIGHQHPAIVAAIQEQAGRLTTLAPGFANDVRAEAARLVAEVAPGDLDQVFFTNGGAEANENAVRMARLHTGRTRSSRPTAATTAPPPARSRSPATRAAGPPSPACPAWSATGGPTSTARPSTPPPRPRSASAH